MQNEQRKLITMAAKSKPSDLSFLGIAEAITQAESKRLRQIMLVLEYIQKSHVFSAKQLEKSIEVSRDSIDRTIRLLEQKKIIELKEKQARGEKFYKIKSESELQFYMDKLKEWAYAKILLGNNVSKGATKLKKTLNRNIKRTMHSSRLISESDQKTQLRFVSKMRQIQITTIPFPDPVIIWDLPYSEASKIVESYGNGLLCEVCFKENKISFLTEHPDEQICESGHVEILQSVDEFSPHSHFLTRKKSSLSDSEFNIQTQEYLGKPKKSRIKHG